MKVVACLADEAFQSLLSKGPLKIGLNMIGREEIDTCLLENLVLGQAAAGGMYL